MSARRIDGVSAGDALPVTERATDIVQSFFYNAALWNAHRIHYELDYATRVEGYAGLVVPGPLLGDWLGQCAEAFAGEGGRLLALSYANRLATLVGEAVAVGGVVRAVDRAAGEVELELWVKNARGEVVTPGSARVRLA
jgi:3-methylfumaryl-CoA hydratase